MTNDTKKGPISRRAEEQVKENRSILDTFKTTSQWSTSCNVQDAFVAYLRALSENSKVINSLMELVDQLQQDLSVAQNQYLKANTRAEGKDRALRLMRIKLHEARLEQARACRGYYLLKIDQEREFLDKGRRESRGPTSTGQGESDL